MPPEMSSMVVGMLGVAAVLVVALFLPLILQFLLLFFIGWAFHTIVSFVSSTLYRLFTLIGTPLHELSHACARLLTLCGVDAIKLLSDHKSVGFVQPRRTNIVGNLISGIAPLIGGTVVLWLTGTYIIPNFSVPDYSLPQWRLEGASFLPLLGQILNDMAELVRTAFSNLPNLQWDNWRTYAGLYIALSVGISIAPSPGDVKRFVKGLPMLIFLVLVLAAWLYLSDDAQAQLSALYETLGPILLRFSTAITYALVLASVGVLVFLPLRIWQKWRRG